MIVKGYGCSSCYSGYRHGSSTFGRYRKGASTFGSFGRTPRGANTFGQLAEFGIFGSFGDEGTQKRIDWCKVHYPPMGSNTAVFDRCSQDKCFVKNPLPYGSACAVSAGEPWTMIARLSEGKGGRDLPAEEDYRKEYDAWAAKQQPASAGAGAGAGVCTKITGTISYVVLKDGEAMEYRKIGGAKGMALAKDDFAQLQTLYTGLKNVIANNKLSCAFSDQIAEVDRAFQQVVSSLNFQASDDQKLGSPYFAFYFPKATVAYNQIADLVARAIRMDIPSAPMPQITNGETFAMVGYLPGKGVWPGPLFKYAGTGTGPALSKVPEKQGLPPPPDATNPGGTTSAATPSDMKAGIGIGTVGVGVVALLLLKAFI